MLDTLVTDTDTGYNRKTKKAAAGWAQDLGGEASQSAALSAALLYDPQFSE